MISILIPIFNSDVRGLVNALLTQSQDLNVRTEIVLLDDGSTDAIADVNQELRDSDGVHYEKLTQNVGRSEIRNRLAQLARYEHLLFLDDDSAIISDDFLHTYLQKIEGHQVLVGGRLYAQERPSQEFRLHWRYGRTRETRSLTARQEHPYRLFHSNNFLVSRQICLEHPFASPSNQYGYEDLLLAQTLKAKGIKITHIDNPVRHVGLDQNKRFLEKHRLAARSLASCIANDFPLNTRLETAYHSIDASVLSRILWPMLHLLEEFVLSRLPQGSLSLVLFDLRRLSWVRYEMARH